MLSAFSNARASTVAFVLGVSVLGGLLLNPTTASAKGAPPCPRSGEGGRPEPKDTCMKLAVRLIPVTSSNATGCAQALFMQVPLDLKDNIVEYVASWSWDTPAAEKSPWTFTATGGADGTGSGPYGEEQWSTKALTAQNTGVNIKPYKVPHGHGAWFVAAGGGPPPCTVQTGSATAWAWRTGHHAKKPSRPHKRDRRVAS